MRVMVEMRETEVEETTVEIGSREEIVPYPEPVHDKSVIDYPSDSREDGVGEKVLLEYELEPVQEIPSVDELFDAFDKVMTEDVITEKETPGEATHNISLDELPYIILFSSTSDIFFSASIIPKPIVSLVPYYEFTPSPTNNLDDSGSTMLRISPTPYSSSTNVEFSSPASPS